MTPVPFAYSVHNILIITHVCVRYGYWTEYPKEKKKNVINQHVVVDRKPKTENQTDGGYKNFYSLTTISSQQQCIFASYKSVRGIFFFLFDWMNCKYKIP